MFERIENVELGIASHNLGSLYTDSDKLQEAERLHWGVLDGHKKARGPDYTSTLDIVQQLRLLATIQAERKGGKEKYSIRR